MTFQYDSMSYHLVSYHLNRAYICLYPIFSHRILSRRTSSHLMMFPPTCLIMSHLISFHLIRSFLIMSHHVSTSSGFSCLFNHVSSCLNMSHQVFLRVIVSHHVSWAAYDVSPCLIMYHHDSSDLVTLSWLIRSQHVSSGLWCLIMSQHVSACLITSHQVSPCLIMSQHHQVFHV
jgi:hypothetical protein